MSGHGDGKISPRNVLPFVLIGCVVSLLLGGAVWMVSHMKDLPPPESWNVGPVVRAELLSNLEEKPLLTIKGVLVPTGTRTRKQTLVVTEQWQFLVDGQWLLPKGAQMEVRQDPGAFDRLPRLCVRAE
ncbi:hypothetical protein, partial [Mesorhizobium sp. M7A.T.Ca.US.000.02.2.1]